jgi:phospho-N-acetylmuramoyl-pentapeptide-transferase
MMSGFDVMRIFVPATITFLIGVGITPFLTHFLYKYKLWKPRGGKIALDGKPASVFNSLHERKEVGTPRFGGIIVWGSVLITAALLQVAWVLFPTAFEELAFISRNQTWLPLAALLSGAIVGLIDDFSEVRGKEGLRLRMRLLLVAVVATFCGWWFFAKLGVVSVSLPFVVVPITLGVWFIPFFVLVTLFIYAGGVIDGIDGLAGGIFATIFTAYGGIAFFQDQLDISALCAALVGGLLAFLWFNIPPARFYLSETGTMGLTLALAVIAFLTDTLGGGKGVGVLPIIALPLVATALSNILQIVGKKVFGKKIFRIAPLHHHFEALGWPPYKVTMRYWVVGVIAALIGMILALL